MLKIGAVCVTCGAFKKAAVESCPECGYEPESEYEVARALILSKAFPAGKRIIGRSVDELRAIGEQIRGGRPYYFDAQEQQDVVKAYRDYTNTKSGRNVSVFLKWLLPLLLILILAAASLLWFRTR